MSPREEDELREVDALVGAYLAKQAAGVDADAGVHRVRAAVRRPASPPARRSWLALAAGIAVVVGLGYLIGVNQRTARAGPHELVREIQRVHKQPLERCYVVEITRLANEDRDGTFPDAPTPQVRTWTRGDRFWVEMKHPGTNRPFVWGREADGSLWAALGPRRGVRVTAEQTPRALALLADTYSLNLDTLLEQVLNTCTLTTLPEEGSPMTRVVRATPNTARTRLWLREATLEIDQEAKVLRRLRITRNRVGVPFAKATFTLVDTRPAEEAKYQLEGHLESPFRIHQGDIDPLLKLELVRRWFNPGSASRQPSDRAVTFTDVAGVAHTPLTQLTKKATVLFFLLPDCPIANAYAPEIKRICAECEAKNVATFVVHADPDVTVEAARKHAKDYGYTCPVLRDPTHLLVKRTGVTQAPEVAVLGPDGKVLYRGRIDDWYVDYGKRQAEPTRRDLRLALEAILAGKPVATPTTKVIGCYLPDPKK